MTNTPADHDDDFDSELPTAPYERFFEDELTAAELVGILVDDALAEVP